MISLVETTTGKVLVEKLTLRSSFLGRLKGLLFHRQLQRSSAMLLLNTKRVHTFGMLFPLDIYYFDSSMSLIGILNGIGPWRIPPSPKETRHILELDSRNRRPMLGLEVGDRVSIAWKITL